MSKNKIFYGNTEIVCSEKPVRGEYLEIEGERFYKISNFDGMAPFFMSIVSSSDHWMFISSNGGLTAGRRNPDNALFPYYTDDKIHDSNHSTGSKTVIQVVQGEKIFIWEPFSELLANIYRIKRNIYKNIPGNKIIFEEENIDLELKFSYTWLNSEEFGFVKKSNLTNAGADNIQINILDGIQNILPYGLYQQFQNEYSTLADGYKKNELLKEYGIGLFSLSSIPSDKAEPSESLRTTIAWSCGIEVKNHLLSSNQLSAFRTGKKITNEIETKAQRGAFFINADLSLEKNERKEWLLVSDINQDLNSISKIINLLNDQSKTHKIVLEDIEDGTEKLINIVATADGQQLGKDELTTSRHFSNVLFNTMRGGIFDNSYTIDKNDLIKYLDNNNPTIVSSNNTFFDELEESISLFELLEKVELQNDNELERLLLEYLPITFSRRHGDPSRPWNRFSIDIKDEKNNKILNYEGNWRDLFQNWEALALSYPEYLLGMITKFLNASTADGYNPYRVTRDGFDWEIMEIDVPWSNIGYWGDHQIIYLLKLLEQLKTFNPNVISTTLEKNLFTYANVPYKIKDYADLISDPQNTIEFDYEKQKNIEIDEVKFGTNAKYLHDQNKDLIKVNLIEKLLVALLAKLSNFIPGAGIWMNTQRPEWNDANNALVGNGVSMVTLCYIRRYVSFFNNILSGNKLDETELTSEVSKYFLEIFNALKNKQEILDDVISDFERKQILDSLGIAGQNFRNLVYDGKLSQEKEKVEFKSIQEFLSLVNKYVDHTIESNRRKDGLYHSYNLISIKDSEIEITNLYEMLEGQVAVLSSGILSPSESIEVIESLRQSSLYREDQNSYILYPNRILPEFVKKNVIKPELVESSELLLKLVHEKNDDIIYKDENGGYHFNGDLKNSIILEEKLLQLDIYTESSKQEIEKVFKIYEDLFNHKAFTGRSGTFYKYEGLGSVYWHMVSKLVLSLQENYYWALDKNTSHNELQKLIEYYYELKEGIGVHKSPKDYGAFPTDPYSHTPIFSGVQQPGMTGQVKEDIISRFGELGIRIKDGQINFHTDLFKTEELISEPTLFEYMDVFGTNRSLQLEKGSMAFTFCQVPFIYTSSDKAQITVFYSDETKDSSVILELNKEISKSIFMREGTVKKILIEIGT